MALKISDKQLELLKKDFPKEALSIDNSRGFKLTSIKAAYVIERLNDVFGVLGWRYAFSEPKQIENEVTVVVTLYIPNSEEKFHTISQFGGKKIIKNNYTDACKSAVTDGLTKCASILGIGHTVFKGQVTNLDSYTPDMNRGGNRTKKAETSPEPIAPTPTGASHASKDPKNSEISRLNSKKPEQATPDKPKAQITAKNAKFKEIDKRFTAEKKRLGEEDYLYILKSFEYTTRKEVGTIAEAEIVLKAMEDTASALPPEKPEPSSEVELPLTSKEVVAKLKAEQKRLGKKTFDNILIAMGYETAKKVDIVKIDTVAKAEVVLQTLSRYEKQEGNNG